MRRPISAVTLAAASAALAACGIHRAENAGPDTNRAFPVGNFTSIEVAGPYQVYVHTGGAPGVTVKGPQNILDHMVVEVDGSKLEIHSKNSGLWGGIHWSSHSPVTVEVVTPALDGATIAGSGDVTAQSSGTAELRIMGSGDVTVTGGAKCTVSKMGSGSAHCS